MHEHQSPGPVLTIALRLARVGFVARLLRRPLINKLVWPFRAGSLVRGTPAFVLREYCKRTEPCLYTLRASGLRIYVRHTTVDLGTLGEIFLERQYDLPLTVRDYLSSLRRPPRVLDIGANIGLFGAYIFGLYPNALVVGFEPDPQNAAVHRLTIEANDLAGTWQLVEAAALEREGEVRFVGGRNVYSRISEADASTLVRCVDVLPRLAEVDLAKIDIEGGEWAILSDPRLAALGPPALVLEYHSLGCPGADSRSAARDLLLRAGYRVSVLRETISDYGQVGMLWAWRPEIEASA